MRIALGIHIGHNRGAAIIKDGVVIGPISQERLDRIKHSSSSKIPIESINILLKHFNLTIRAVSCIGISYNSVERLSVERYYKEEFEKIYECIHMPIFFTNHHIAHAYSAFFHLVLMKPLYLWPMKQVIILMVCKKLNHFLLLKIIK